MLVFFAINIVLLLSIEFLSIFYLIQLYFKNSPPLPLVYEHFISESLIYIIALLIILNICIIIFSIIFYRKDKDLSSLKAVNIMSLIYNLVLIPFYILLFGFAAFLTLVALSFIGFIGAPFITNPIIFTFAYIFLFSSSIFSFQLLRIAYYNNLISKINFTVSTVLLFVFVTDVFVKIYIYNLIKKSYSIK